MQKVGFAMNTPTKPIEAIRAVIGLAQPPVKSASVPGSGFQEAMAQALKETSSLQKESGRLSKEFTLENPTVSLEETMLVSFKSGVAFQATLQVRNKVIQA